MKESTSEYETIDGNWLACTLCGATIWFAYMTTHSAWHHGPEIVLPEEAGVPRQVSPEN